jgi:DNA polymerase-3 subunit chi
MTVVSFHFNVADRREYACRLLRKATRSGARVAVAGPVQALSDLDRSLWMFDPLDFVPHWRGKSSTELPQRLRSTPIVLVDELDDLGAYPVLLNLHADVPAMDAFPARVIEIVGRHENDRAAARERWRAYARAGVTIERHEVAG